MTGVADLSKVQLLALYRTMAGIRRTEEQLVKLYAAGKIYGGCHTYIGEEAVATGVCAHLRHEDVVFSTHRGHGHALAKGITPRELIAELLGRATGCSGGRGGSMHLFKPEVGFMGSSGIVGPSITLEAGGGYTAQLLKTGHVSVAFFGDGAVNKGTFHEALNFAARNPMMAAGRLDRLGTREVAVACGLGGSSAYQQRGGDRKGGADAKHRSSVVGFGDRCATWTTSSSSSSLTSSPSSTSRPCSSPEPSCRRARTSADPEPRSSTCRRMSLAESPAT